MPPSGWLLPAVHIFTLDLLDDSSQVQSQKHHLLGLPVGIYWAREDGEEMTFGLLEQAQVYLTFADISREYAGQQSCHVPCLGTSHALTSIAAEGDPSPLLGDPRLVQGQHCHFGCQTFWSGSQHRHLSLLWGPCREVWLSAYVSMNVSFCACLWAFRVDSALAFCLPWEGIRKVGLSHRLYS